MGTSSASTPALVGQHRAQWCAKGRSAVKIGRNFTFSQWTSKVNLQHFPGNIGGFGPFTYSAAFVVHVWANRKEGKGWTLGLVQLMNAIAPGAKFSSGL